VLETITDISNKWDKYSTCISHKQRIHKTFLNVREKQVHEQSIILNVNGNRRKTAVLTIPSKPSSKLSKSD